VNEGRIYFSDVLIGSERIEKIEPNISLNYKVIEIDVEGKYYFPDSIMSRV
jgi:dihydroorotase-like cyclic amidohydrolase